MRILFWFLLLAAAAVAVALLARVVSGYVLLVAPPYRVELSLNLLLVLIVLGFLAGYALLRIALRTSALPAEVRAMRRRQQETRVRTKLDAAVVALLEGRYGKATLTGRCSAFPASTPAITLQAREVEVGANYFTMQVTITGGPNAGCTSVGVMTGAKK